MPENARQYDCPEVEPGAELYVLSLHRACEKLGGIGQLARALGVSAIRVMRWLDGTMPVPQRVFLQAVDILVR